MKKIFICIIFTVACWGCSKDSNKGTSSTSGSTGQGGSLARFIVAQNHLYVVENRNLKVFSLANPVDPILTKEIAVGWDIETIYSFEDKLFIGSMSAMYVYSITNPSSPQYLGEASHVRACDPVIANDSVAYVTVRSASDCGGTTNALYVYDISNILNPYQKNTIPLTGPWGLGMRDDRLYVCDGGEGLMVYNITNPNYPSFIKKVTGEIFYDVIVVDDEDILICMIQGGVAIYDISNDNLTKLAEINN